MRGSYRDLNDTVGKAKIPVINKCAAASRPQPMRYLTFVEMFGIIFIESKREITSLPKSH